MNDENNNYTYNCNLRYQDIKKPMFKKKDDEYSKVGDNQLEGGNGLNDSGDDSVDFDENDKKFGMADIAELERS